MKVLNFGKQTWKRPSDWIQIPDPQEDEILMLYPVRATDNNFAVKVQGAYTIDWGDGTIENYNSGDQAEHSYDYNTLNAPLDNAGCKQVIIKIKPQAGNNITNFTLNLTLASGKPNNSILEFKGNLPYFNSSNMYYLFYNQYLLKSVYFYNFPKLTLFRNIFSGCDIKNFNFNIFKNTSGVLDSALRGINYIKDYEITIDTTKYAYLGYVFSNKYAPIKINIVGDNPNCIFSRTFQCQLIEEINIQGKLYTNALSYMFYGCNELEKIDGIENIVVTEASSFDYCFYQNNNLKKIEIDMANATSAIKFIYACKALQKIKLINIPKINIDIMYSNLTREQLIDIFNSLPDASGDSTSPTLTITGCRGVVDLSDNDKAIATDKNWTLVT